MRYCEMQQRHFFDEFALEVVMQMTFPSLREGNMDWKGLKDQQDLEKYVEDSIGFSLLL